jgi:hypothetical protein
MIEKSGGRIVIQIHKGFINIKPFVKPQLGSTKFSQNHIKVNCTSLNHGENINLVSRVPIFDL